MNESENLLILSLVQLGWYLIYYHFNSLPKDSNITSFLQLTNDEFIRTILKCCKKIINIKGLDISIADNLSRDLNLKYKESQKLVDFIKVYSQSLLS